MKIKFDAQNAKVSGTVEAKIITALMYKFACTIGKHTGLTIAADEKSIVLHNSEGKVAEFKVVNNVMWEVALNLLQTAGQDPGLEILLQDGRLEAIYEALSAKQQISLKGKNTQQMAEMVIWANILASVWPLMTEVEKFKATEAGHVYRAAQKYAWTQFKRTLPNDQDMIKGEELLLAAAAQVEAEQNQPVNEPAQQPVVEESTVNPLNDKLYHKWMKKCVMIQKTLTNFDTRVTRDHKVKLSWNNGLTLISYKKWLADHTVLVPKAAKGTREFALRGQMNQLSEVISEMLVAVSVWDKADHLKLLDLYADLRDVEKFRLARPKTTTREKVVTVIAVIAKKTWAYAKFFGKLIADRAVRVAKAIWSGVKTAWNFVSGALSAAWNWAFGGSEEVQVVSEQGSAQVQVG
jgi:hypothetical protein